MKVRTILLAVALSSGLIAVSEAKTKKVVITNKQAARAARRNAKRQVKFRVRKTAKVRRTVKR